MISLPQIESNICRAYMARVRENFPTETYFSNRYLHILKIREWQIRRKMLNKSATLENLATLKHGHREAERFYLDISVGSPSKTLEEINEILQLIAIGFHAEIVEIEQQHPHMRAEFAREREEYRLMWNDYISEA